MSRHDRQKWDQRYADPSHQLGKRAHTLLQQFAPPAIPGCRALELACGLGYSALWLAEQGYTVDAIDISFEALRRAQTEKLRRHLTNLTFIAADLDHFPLPGYAYDLVYGFRFLDRRLFPIIRERVRPGGLVIYETLNVRQQERYPGRDPSHLLALGELPAHFPGWQIIAARDDRYTSAFVGRKPKG
ncbi:MAG: class I SAM-dependent methyltransferase [Anaerolineae bacterium]|nr:class I SAM-dependent methyltransferase [Anaerolineae bacterium]